MHVVLPLHAFYKPSYKFRPFVGPENSHWQKSHPPTQLEGTPRVRTHTVIPYSKFEHFGIIRFWVMLWLLVWKMHLLTLWPWPLTTEPQIHVTSSIFQNHSLYQVWKLWDQSCFSYAADKQTNKQTDRRMDSKILPMLTDKVGMGN